MDRFEKIAKDLYFKTTHRLGESLPSVDKAAIKLIGSVLRQVAEEQREKTIEECAKICDSDAQSDAGRVSRALASAIRHTSIRKGGK